MSRIGIFSRIDPIPRAILARASGGSFRRFLIPRYKRAIDRVIVFLAYFSIIGLLIPDSLALIVEWARAWERSLVSRSFWTNFRMDRISCEMVKTPSKWLTPTTFP